MAINQTWEILKENVQWALRLIEEHIVAAEAFYTLKNLTQIQIRNSEITGNNQGIDGGIGFRTLIGGNRLGFTSTNNFLKKEEVLKAVENAINLAQISTPNEHVCFPEKSNPKIIKGLFDNEFVTTTIDEALDIAKSGLIATEAVDKRVKVKRGELFLEYGWKGIQNTLGVEVETKNSRGVFYLGAIAQEQDQVTGLCSEINRTTSLDFDAQKQGETVARKVLNLLNPKTITSFTGPVIFSPEVVADHIFAVITEALKGDNVIANSSAWTDRIGSPVAINSLTISDNPLLQANFASQPFDDEGAATTQTLLVKNGELKQFLQHSSSAKAFNDKTTGNASRYGTGWDITRLIVGSGYKVQPIVYPHNLIIEPSQYTLTDLIEEVSHGLFIDSVAGFPHPGSGLVSAQISRGFFIEKGELTQAIKDTMVVGNVFEWLQHISGVSKETKQFDFCHMPALRVEEVKIVGREQ
ncbi:MAG: TldD/PmbA family protein [Candidatus Heimdallarchaeota archaeon]|nr:TldD/PmbA family protein [Candidatus Heimdallarchaeota archaeon]